MKRRFDFVLTSLVPLFLMLGCEPPASAPPVTLAEYEQMSSDDFQKYPSSTILLHNLQRAMDPELEAGQRADSLKVATQLGGANPDVLTQLSSILADPKSPISLREELLSLLVQKDYPGMAQYVVQALPHMRGQSSLRDDILEWLVRHPQPLGLAHVVRLWAGEPLAGPDEPRFRKIVENITGRKWQEALLEAINTPRFFGRGSAIEILAARTPRDELRRRISRSIARTQAMAALQTFTERFGYLPGSGRELFLAASIRQKERDLIPIATEVNRRWRKDHGYRFNIRDFHLLSRLGLDPLRPPLSRSELILRLGATLEARNHVHHQPSAPGAPDDYVDLFATHVEALTISDLWNLYLLNEMLSIPKYQRAFRIVAARDRADQSSAWGGLVFYEKGRARAVLYPAQKGLRNDLVYVPGEQFRVDSRSALCRFHAHFEKVYNTRRAGPGADDLIDAQKGNHYGLVLTSISENAFCAHYYSPEGIVVSLGKFPFKH